jgi:hypothetical protein
MWVNNLQTFLATNKDNATLSTKKYVGKGETILFASNGFFIDLHSETERRFPPPVKDSDILGGDLGSFRSALTHIVKQLNSLELTVIFALDAPRGVRSDPTARDTVWCHREKQRHVVDHGLLEYCSGKSPSRPVTPWSDTASQEVLRPLPTMLLTQAHMTLVSLGVGVQVIEVDDEVDFHIGSLVSKYNVHYVVANDTDFVVTEGVPAVLTSIDFPWDSLLGGWNGIKPSETKLSFRVFRMKGLLHYIGHIKPRTWTSVMLWRAVSLCGNNFTSSVVHPHYRSLQETLDYVVGARDLPPEVLKVFDDQAPISVTHSIRRYEHGSSRKTHSALAGEDRDRFRSFKNNGVPLRYIFAVRDGVFVNEFPTAAAQRLMLAAAAVLRLNEEKLTLWSNPCSGFSRIRRLEVQRLQSQFTTHEFDLLREPRVMEPTSPEEAMQHACDVVKRVFGIELSHDRELSLDDSCVLPPAVLLLLWMIKADLSDDTFRSAVAMTVLVFLTRPTTSGDSTSETAATKARNLASNNERRPCPPEMLVSKIFASAYAELSGFLTLFALESVLPLPEPADLFSGLLLASPSARDNLAHNTDAFDVTMSATLRVISSWPEMDSTPCCQPEQVALRVKAAAEQGYCCENPLVAEYKRFTCALRAALNKSMHLIGMKRPKLKEAFEVIVKSLVIDRARFQNGEMLWKLCEWSDIRQTIMELFRLAFTLRGDGGDSFHDMWRNLSFMRDGLRLNPDGMHVWNQLTREMCKQIEALVKDAQARAAQALAAVTASSIVALVAGRADESLINQRCSVDPFVATVIDRTVNARFMGNDSWSLQHTCDIVESFAKLVDKYKLTFAAQSLAKTLHGYLEAFLFSPLVEYTPKTNRNAHHNEITRRMRDNRTEFQNNVNVMERTFEVALLVQRVVLDIGNWQCLSDSVSLITRILLEFPPEGKHAHFPVVATVYKRLADVFLQCKNHTFHAYCLSKAAAAEQKIVVATNKTMRSAGIKTKAIARVVASAASTATAAVLAVLAAPSIGERRNQFGEQDADFRRLSDLAMMFKLGVVPSHATLCGALRSSGCLVTAVPAAEKLFALLTAPVIDADTCANTALYLSELAMSMPSFEKTYGPKIRSLSLKRYFLLVAESKNSISLRADKLNIGDHRTSVEANRELLLRVLLDELHIPVLVDQGTAAVTFPSVSLARMHITFAKLAEAAAPPRTVAQPKRQPLIVDLQTLELESNRMIAFHSLVKDRVKATVELKDKRFMQIYAQKEARKQAVIDAEANHQRKIQEENDKRMAREYQLAELKERRKLLIRRVQEKHKGLKVNPAIVDLNQQSFIDNLTAALTEFQRRLETAKRSDVRKMDHFERACREKDIPKRKEITASMVGDLEIERQTRWANNLKQHRKEFEERAATRTRLQKFLRHAAQYEAQLSERATKVTKRDEQEDLLKAEKARLAQASGQTQTVPAPAPAPTAAAPAASNPSADAASLPAPVAGAKWAPRQKKPDA